MLGSFRDRRTTHWFLFIKSIGCLLHMGWQKGSQLFIFLHTQLSIGGWANSLYSLELSNFRVGKVNLNQPLVYAWGRCYFIAWVFMQIGAAPLRDSYGCLCFSDRSFAYEGLSLVGTFILQPVVDFVFVDRLYIDERDKCVSDS
ncbi:hypothetical protein F4860DRAFT_350300 [Xylaria cubensis]|nr:hypothetical protein F4860DRAFT_350300 [Xylaria cubensis]